MTLNIINIKSEVQKKGTLCWASCVQMILSQNAIVKNQWEILAQYNLLNTPQNNMHLMEIGSNPCSVEEEVFPRMGTGLLLYQKLLDSYCLNSQKKTGGFIREENIKKIIDQKQCILISKSHVPPIRFHAFLIVGYCDELYFQICVNDPFIFYKIPSFDACLENNKGGKCIFNYSNYRYFNKQFENGNHFENIQVISNFSKMPKRPKRRLVANIDNATSAITFPTISDCLASFSSDFIIATFGYQISMDINPIVPIFSYEKNNIADLAFNNGLMFMPVFDTENKLENSYLEFVFIKVSYDKFVPICIREPYFTGYDNIASTMIPETESNFVFDHNKPNYWLSMIPNTGYMFMGFHFNGVSFFTPLYDYSEIGVKTQIAISQKDFLNLNNKFKF